MLAQHTSPYLVHKQPHNKGELYTLTRKYVDEPNLRMWNILLRRGKHSHNGLHAKLQRDNYYRCHFIFEGEMIQGVCKTKPWQRLVPCCIVPKDGLEKHQYDSLKVLVAPLQSIDVLWDTTQSDS